MAASRLKGQSRVWRQDPTRRCVPRPVGGWEAQAREGASFRVALARGGLALAAFAIERLLLHAERRNLDEDLLPEIRRHRFLLLTLRSAALIRQHHDPDRFVYTGLRRKDHANP
jgi:hypothetical protein